MKLISFFKKVRKPLFIITFIVLQSLSLYNFILLSKDMIYGDSSGLYLKPLPRYGFMRVPENTFTLKYEAFHRLAADFAQIYFPSQKLSSLTTAYTKDTLDPWQRPSRYAPFIHAVYSFSFCKFEYGFASFLHMLVQMLLFFASFIYAFKILRIEKDLFPVILLVNFCLFLTPVGLSWFERGQFSLYVSLSYLWLFLGLVNRNGYYIFISALFAYARGFVHEVFAVVGWIGAIFATFYGFPHLVPYGRQLIPIDLAADVATGLVIFIFTLVFLSMMTRSISRGVQKSALNALDRSLGFLFGLARGSLIVVISYIGLELVMPENRHPSFIHTSHSIRLIRPASRELIRLLPILHNGSAQSGYNQNSSKEAGKVVLDIISPSPKSQASPKKSPKGYGLRPRQDMDRLIRNAQGQ